jgi:CRISPR-associated protein Csb2
MRFDCGSYAGVYTSTSWPPGRRVRFVWPPGVTADPQVSLSLEALLARVVSLGHSSSLVRCGLFDAVPANGRVWHPVDATDASDAYRVRVMYRGRLVELESAFARGERPRPGRIVSYLAPGRAVSLPPVASVFGGVNDWFVFEDAGGFCPDLLSTACCRHGEHPADAARAKACACSAVPCSEIRPLSPIQSQVSPRGRCDGGERRPR